jgi:CheY-like chemotaxis protein
MQPGIKVVAEAEDGSSAISMVEKNRPEIVLMDISMPVLDGIEATRIIRSKSPAQKFSCSPCIQSKSFQTGHTKPVHAVFCQRIVTKMNCSEQSRTAPLENEELLHR